MHASLLAKRTQFITELNAERLLISLVLMTAQFRQRAEMVNELLASGKRSTCCTRRQEWCEQFANDLNHFNCNTICHLHSRTNANAHTSAIASFFSVFSSCPLNVSIPFGRSSFVRCQMTVGVTMRVDTNDTEWKMPSHHVSIRVSLISRWPFWGCGQSARTRKKTLQNECARVSPSIVKWQNVFCCWRRCGIPASAFKTEFTTHCIGGSRCRVRGRLLRCFFFLPPNRWSIFLCTARLSFLL